MKSKRYWVEDVDGNEIGDFAGFLFHSWDDAVHWVDSFYRDDGETQRLQIVVLTAESIHDMPRAVR